MQTLILALRKGAKQTHINQHNLQAKMTVSNVGFGAVSLDPISERLSLQPFCSMALATKTSISAIADEDTVLKVEYELDDVRES